MAAEISSRLKRLVAVYGLYGAAGLLVIFSAGYALDALHGLLASSFGEVQASLLIAALLLVLAVFASVVAVFIGRRRETAPDLKGIALAAMPELGHHKAWVPAVCGMILGGVAAAIGLRLNKNRHVLRIRGAAADR